MEERISELHLNLSGVPTNEPGSLSPQCNDYWDLNQLAISYVDQISDLDLKLRLSQALQQMLDLYLDLKVTSFESKKRNTKQPRWKSLSDLDGSSVDGQKCNSIEDNNKYKLLKINKKKHIFNRAKERHGEDSIEDISDDTSHRDSRIEMPSIPERKRQYTPDERKLIFNIYLDCVKSGFSYKRILEQVNRDFDLNKTTFNKLIKRAKQGQFGRAPGKRGKKISTDLQKAIVNLARENIGITYKEICKRTGAPNVQVVGRIVKENNIKRLTSRDKRALKLNAEGLPYTPRFNEYQSRYMYQQKKLKKERLMNGDFTDGRSARHKDPAYASPKDLAGIPPEVTLQINSSARGTRKANVTKHTTFGSGHLKVSDEKSQDSQLAQPLSSTHELNETLPQQTYISLAGSSTSSYIDQIPVTCPSTGYATHYSDCEAQLIPGSHYFNVIHPTFALDFNSQR